MKPFATDEFKNEFVIFRIGDGDEYGAYVWVYDDGLVRVTDIYGLASYCNHSVSPIYVGEDIPEELIDKAYDRLSELTDGEKKELIEGFNEKIERIKEKGDTEREEYEEGVLKDIREGNNVQDGLFWLM